MLGNFATKYLVTLGEVRCCIGRAAACARGGEAALHTGEGRAEDRISTRGCLRRSGSWEGGDQLGELIDGCGDVGRSLRLFGAGCGHTRCVEVGGGCCAL